MIRFARLAAIVILTAGTTMGCSLAGSSATTYTGYQLTCCTQADIQQVWRSGTMFDLHLIATSSRMTGVDPTHRVIITGGLTGPYGDVATLKEGKAAADTVTGSSLTFDDRYPPPADAAMTFSLPADLPPGLYALNLNWDFGHGSSAGAGSVVQVGAAQP